MTLSVNELMQLSDLVSTQLLADNRGRVAELDSTRVFLERSQAETKMLKNECIALRLLNKQLTDALDYLKTKFEALRVEQE